MWDLSKVNILFDIVGEGLFTGWMLLMSFNLHC